MKTKAEKEEQTRKEKERHEKRVGMDGNYKLVNYLYALYMHCIVFS